jgi:hypothetical protein
VGVLSHSLLEWTVRLTNFAVYVFSLSRRANPLRLSVRFRLYSSAVIVSTPLDACVLMRVQAVSKKSGVSSPERF